MTPRRRISIVIPCRCDAAALAATLDHLCTLPGIADAEIIVAASGDEQRTTEAVAGRARLLWPEGSTRAELLNAGAAVASAPIVLFLHADSYLPAGAVGEVQRALADRTVFSGAFEHSFSESDWRLTLSSLINRVRYRLTRNYYGDQAQFVRTDVFRRLGGFRDLPLMEDLDLSQRLKRVGRTALIRSSIRTSGRRFLQRGPFRMLAFCGILVSLRACGADVERFADGWRGPVGQPPGSPGGRWASARRAMGQRSSPTVFQPSPSRRK